MELSEIEPLIKQYNDDYRDRWEQTRFMAFITALSHGAKVTSPKDVITFGWETETKSADLSTAPSQDEIEALMNSMQKSVDKYKAGQGIDLKM